MSTHLEPRIEPASEILAAARAWLTPVRAALGPEFLAAYLTGSVLAHGFNPKRSRVNLAVIARALPADTLDAVAAALPRLRSAARFEPLFLTRDQIQMSLDAFPIEWLEMKERHLLLEGQEVLAAMEVPRTYLRLQLEHELRGKHIQLRQAYIHFARDPRELRRLLEVAASSFAALFRTLVRLRGEEPPPESQRVVERVAELYGLDAQGLASAHHVRHASRRHKSAEIMPLYRRFLAEVDRLIAAIDRMKP
jgi:hypothetical protein